MPFQDTRYLGLYEERCHRFRALVSFQSEHFDSLILWGHVLLALWLWSLGALSPSITLSDLLPACLVIDCRLHAFGRCSKELTRRKLDMFQTFLPFVFRAIFSFL